MRSNSYLILLLRPKWHTKFRCCFVRVLSLLTGILISCNLSAQSETFASDRPGLSDAPDLIRPQTWQIATGFDISKYNHTGNYQLSENTLKYGISKRIEARFDIGLQYDPDSKKYGASGPAVGIKYLLCNQLGIIPKTAFIIEYYPPLFSSGPTSSGLATEFCFSHTFKSGNILYYNAGANWQDIAQMATFNSLIGFSFTVNKVLNSFIELYLYKTPALKMNYVSDAGITYQVSKRLQVDLSAGVDLVQRKGDFNYSGGITYNF
ncbi:MAG: transporter [Bacteroidetes bacterium]|nr:transporter [Bacteroidota bacterium]